MRIGVRVGAIQCLSAPQRPICFSPSPPPLLSLERAAATFPPWRAQQAVRSGCCATESSDRTYVRLALPLLLVRRFAGRGGGGEGGTIITFLSSILGDARRPLSTPCHAQRAVRPGRCAEQLFVCSLACLVVWLPLFAG